MKHPVKQWDIVRSHYRAPWVGVVLNIQKRNGIGDLLRIMRLYDRAGNKMRKKTITYLNEAWVTVVNDEFPQERAEMIEAYRLSK